MIPSIAEIVASDGRLRRAIREEASRHGQDPTAYVESLLVDRAVLQSLMNQVTVQETAFFRHPEQFDVLAHDGLPELEQPVRIWSCACANGQEPYSLAMLVAEFVAANRTRGIYEEDLGILATDISATALAIALLLRLFQTGGPLTLGSRAPPGPRSDPSGD